MDAEHQSIVEAIRRRDAHAAEQLAREHTALFRDRVIGYLSENRSAEIAL